MSNRARRAMRRKDRLWPLNDEGGFAHIKRGRGEKRFAPHELPFRCERLPIVVTHEHALRRQNLTTLCATAGKNLTAIGSSHSLAETVNLGSVATAGLIGTLHIWYTSCQITYARQPEKAAATHSYRLYT